MLRSPVQNAPGKTRPGRKLSAPLALTTRWHRLVVRFRDDQSPEDVIARRSKEEAVRRQQEADMRPPLDNTIQAPQQQQLLHQAHRMLLPEINDGPPAVDPFTPAFTRRREIWMGRLAMLGFFMACVWELVLPGHPNITEQLALPFANVGLPFSKSWVALLLTGLVGYNLVAGLMPGSPTWSRVNQQDVAKRVKSGFGNPLAGPFKFLGITDWGFSKSNELFQGRIAMLGFFAALWQQFNHGGVNGPGPLGQVAGLLGFVPNNLFYGAVPPLFLAFAVLATAAALQRGNFGITQGEDDIY